MSNNKPLSEKVSEKNGRRPETRDFDLSETRQQP